MLPLRYPFGTLKIDIPLLLVSTTFKFEIKQVLFQPHFSSRLI